MPPSVTVARIHHHAVGRSLALASTTSTTHYGYTSSKIPRIPTLARSYEHFDPRGRGMLFSSISSVDSTLSDFHVQPALTNDVQSLHSDDACAPTSKLTVTATSSNAIGTCTVHTMFPYSTLSGHSFTTFHITHIHGPSLTTTPQHSSITHRLYQGIWL